MKDEIIDELIINESSNYSDIKKEFMKIQRNYSIRFLKEFESHFASDSKYLEEERCIYNHICEMIKADIFLHMMGNYSYRDKVKNIFENEEFVLGNSKMKLINLEHTIELLCDSYTKEFQRFVNDSKKQIETELKQIDTNTKNEIKNIFDTKINSSYFFNELSNANLI